MNLPIDFRKGPFKPKYLEEETTLFASWFIFGHYDDGTVSIEDGTNEIITHVPEPAAKLIVASRQRFVNEMLMLLNTRLKDA